MNDEQYNAMWDLDEALCQFLNTYIDGVSKETIKWLDDAYDAAYRVGCFPDKLNYPGYKEFVMSDVWHKPPYQQFKPKGNPKHD